MLVYVFVLASPRNSKRATGDTQFPQPRRSISDLSFHGRLKIWKQTFANEKFRGMKEMFQPLSRSHHCAKSSPYLWSTSTFDHEKRFQPCWNRGCGSGCPSSVTAPAEWCSSLNGHFISSGLQCSGYFSLTPTASESIVGPGAAQSTELRHLTFHIPVDARVCDLV